MRFLALAIASGTALALGNGEPKPGPDGKYTISTPSIKAQVGNNKTFPPIFRGGELTIL